MAKCVCCGVNGADSIDWATVRIEGAALDPVVEIPQVAIRKCTMCKDSLATHGEFCAYHQHREHGKAEDVIEQQTALRYGEAARARMVAMDRNERNARGAAARKELALGHPTTWPSQHDED